MFSSKLPYVFYKTFHEHLYAFFRFAKFLLHPKIFLKNFVKPTLTKSIKSQKRMIR